MPIRCAAATDRGRVRARNEDCVHLDPALGLVAVADGMGGHRAGDVASRLAIAALAAAVHMVPTPADLLPPPSPAELLHSAFAQANAQLFAAANTLPGCSGMGTTLLAAWFTHAEGGAATPPGTRIVFAHVGDSRLYRHRRAYTARSELLALTRDHTTLQELIDGGLYPAEEARRLVGRNYLTRAIGTEPEVDIDLQTLSVLEGDLFMLCSDGLTNMLPDTRIRELLDEHDATGSSLEALAQRLVDAANECGGHDNISVVLASGTAQR
jgi:serine/threonine protein phosphatase PrpC